MKDLVTFRKLDALRGVPHPFPYQGSKRYLANAIIPLLPSDTQRIFEPFCGSAAISIAAKYTGRVKEAVIADVNAPLIELWNAILNQPQELCLQYERMWMDQMEDPKMYFNKVREAFNDQPTPARLLYLLNRIVKGAVRYGRDGRFNQSADNRRLGAKPKVVASRISGVCEVMKGTRAIAGDYASVALEASQADVVYMDPPYQGTSTKADHRYAANLQRTDFEPVLREMNERGLSYIVSYDVVDSNESYGQPLAEDLRLTHLHLIAGTSTQATFLGQMKTTVESLYLSPALVDRIGGANKIRALLNESADTLF